MLSSSFSGQQVATVGYLSGRRATEALWLGSLPGLASCLLSLGSVGTINWKCPAGQPGRLLPWRQAARVHSQGP